MSWFWFRLTVTLCCCSLVCPLDGAILKHLTLLLPPRVCRRGNWGKSSELETARETGITHLVASSCFSSSLSSMHASAHTLLPVCVCVCVRDYFGLLLRAHSCHVCLTALCHQIGPAGFYFFKKNFPGPSRNGCSHSAAAASEL